VGLRPVKGGRADARRGAWEVAGAVGEAGRRPGVATVDKDAI
jgi:hypothetical protein